MNCSSEGDLGDVVYLCGILHGLGGEHTVLLQMSERTKARGPEGLASLDQNISPLLNSQQYIKECRPIRPTDTVQWASAKFRQQGHYRQGESLLRAHLNHLIATLDIGHDITGKDKWLTAIRDPRSKGKIIVSRSGRYRNQYMPWLEIVKHYSHRLLFVGLKHEWKEFCSMFGYVDYAPTANLLEVAQLIEGAEMFIGNQSSPFAVAEGLKKPRILEVSTEFPDTIFGGPQTWYVVDGTVSLPDVQGSGTLDLHSKAFSIANITTLYVPPGGWQYNSDEIGHVMTSNAETCARDVVKRMKGRMTREEALRQVIAQNVQRVPRHFAKYMQMPSFGRVRAALEAAGVTSHPILSLLKGDVKFNLNT